MNADDAGRGGLTARETAMVWLGTALWTAGITAAVAVTLATDGAAGWVTGGIAALAVAGLMLVAVAVARTALRREGVERTVGIEASALAFWATMGGVLTYGMIDAFADVPALRWPWVVFFGLVAWSTLHAGRLKRYL
jgi:hypothetical protein